MKKRNKNLSAITLIELMISLVIVSALLALGISSLSGLGTKQKLSRSIQNLETLIQKAQSTASDVNLWTCISFESAGKATVYTDNDANHGLSNGCGNSGDQIAMNLESGIVSPVDFASCTGNISSSCDLWVNPEGRLYLCSNSGNCGQSISTLSGGGANCIPWDYQIVLSSSELESNARSREIEISRAGIIHLPKLGEKGNFEQLWAKVASLGSGSGACE